MSESDRSHNDEPRSDADRTLLGVAPPKIESSVTPLRSPVFVRSGTSIADIEPPPLSRRALPRRAPSLEAVASAAAPAPNGSDDSGVAALMQRVLRFTRVRPALWMLLAPVLLSVSLSALLFGLSRSHASKGAGVTKTQHVAALASAEPQAPSANSPSSASPSAAVLAELEARPPESLRARELVLLAEGRSERQRAAAAALRRKVEQNPALAEDKTLLKELLRLADDPRTAPDALAAMAALDAPVAADLLYELWTGTPVRSDVTELSRALVFSPEVRAKASPALAVALELRSAERCEQYQASLPQALKDGDRRSFHLLQKLTSKRGCGPKKSADCFACLRAPSSDLGATISAVKSRRPPNYVAP